MGPSKSLLLCALSDGAGSAKFAVDASHFLVAEALRFLEKQLADHPDPIALLAGDDPIDCEAFLDSVQNGLRQMATTNNAGVDDYSATLLFAAIHPQAALFFQIGDGCWIVAREGVYGAVTWPTQGEFVGQTVFVTSSKAGDNMQMQTVLGKLTSVVGITDGLERLALDVRACHPHPGFFDPLVKALIKAKDVSLFQRDLGVFLNSERVCERTDDDKSIIIATRDHTF